VPPAASSLLKDRVRIFFRQLSLALAGDPEGIHQMRVAGRRVRVALPLVAAKPDARRVRRVRRALKRLLRTAAPARDLDVCVALFEAELAARGVQSVEATQLRRRLRTARSRSRSRLREALLDHDIAGLRRELRGLEGEVEVSAGVVLSRIREARDVQGAELLSEMERLGDRFEGDELHDLRRRVRRLRYVAEVASELDGSRSRAPKQLKRLQEDLGNVHDAYVLGQWLGRQAEAAEKRRVSLLAAEARRLETAFGDLARARHQEYLAHDPVATLKRALGVLVPAPWEAGGSGAEGEPGGDAAEGAA
jgi:CHAD domain-containing protein